MFREFIDISWMINARTPVFPGDCPYQARQSLSIAGGDICNLSEIKMSMHFGTHIDAPLHFIDHGKPVPELDLSLFFGEATVIEIDNVKEITAGEIAKHSFKPGQRLLLKVPGNETLLDKAEFSNDFIGMDRSAAEFLVERGVPLVGIEYLSIEKPVGNDYPVHHILLGNDIIILEGIDLRKVEPGDYFLACQPLKLENGNGSPVRAVLMRQY